MPKPSPLADACATHLARTLQGLQPMLGARLNERHFNAVGQIAFTLDTTGADPGDCCARTKLSILSGILPGNSLVHQWRANTTGDGVRVLRSRSFDEAERPRPARVPDAALLPAPPAQARTARPVWAELSWGR